MNVSVVNVNSASCCSPGCRGTVSIESRDTSLRESDAAHVWGLSRVLLCVCGMHITCQSALFLILLYARPIRRWVRRRFQSTGTATLSQARAPRRRRRRGANADVASGVDENKGKYFRFSQLDYADPSSAGFLSGKTSCTYRATHPRGPYRTIGPVPT